MSIVAAGREPQVLATVDMGESCMASPMIADKTLYIRTASRLYAIAREGDS